MIVKQFTQTAFQQNTRIVACERTGSAICIDPGESSPDIVDYITSSNFTLEAICLTHGHLDHIGGTSYLAGIYPEAEIIAHSDESDLYYSLPDQPLLLGIPKAHLEALGMQYEPPPPITRFAVHGEELSVGDLRFEFRHCPGHTLGHIVLVERAERTVFTGDCLFNGSIGRTDLPGGDHNRLIASLETQLLSLADDFTVCCGHGPNTTIGHERSTNPFLRKGRAYE